MVRRLVVAGALCAGVSPVFLAGSPQVVVTQGGAPMPPGAVQAPARTGSGLVVGQVVDADGDRPLPGATVMLTAGGALTGEAPAPGPPPGRRTVTDGQGRFMFHSVPAGRVSLVVQASGYMNASPGQGRPGGPSPLITLADGERLGHVRVRMWRHAAIEGRVVNERGDPLVGHPVRPLRREWVGGGLRLTPLAPATTDDRGMFRLWSLTPGDYILTVPSTQITMPVSVAVAYLDLLQQQSANVMQTDLVRRLSGSGAPSGSAGGQPVGNHVLQVGRGSVAAQLSVAAAGRMAVYATTYAPSLTDDPIRLESGEERLGIEVVVPLVPASSVSGVAIGPDGLVPHLGLRLTSTALGDGPPTSGLETASTVTDAQGMFTFLGVPAGEYTLAGAVCRAAALGGRAGFDGRDRQNRTWSARLGHGGV